SISCSDGTGRRSCPGPSAPGRDRAAAGGRLDRQSPGRLHLRRDRGPVRLARHLRRARAVRVDRGDSGVLRFPGRGGRKAGAVPLLVAHIAQRRLMIIGGTLAAAALVLIALEFPWYAQAGVFAVLGFGFYLLHGSIQVHVTELSPTARGLAASLHSCFFYLGQATGPVVYGFGFAHGGETSTMLTGALVVTAVGLVCARLLRHRALSH